MFVKHLTLYEARRRAKWTQEELGKHSGLRQGVISRLESGDVHNPTFKTVLKLAEALDLDPRVLRFGTHDEAVA